MNFAAKPFEKDLSEQGAESVDDPLKGRFRREQHGGRAFEGVAVRVTRRDLATAAEIWDGDLVGAPVTRSLTTCDN
ncbi:hypothetical protein GCM10017600_54030 [Streptosporangium carneum]|uniref:Uncharacterized protein n=1 Tax=Streptosporangium carneum TaxID=47481 RepID=A0A9W6MFE6_9ACTN|nr:hypothetical protein GCM10017600_54030 [Streptosporangium carneum]